MQHAAVAAAVLKAYKNQVCPGLLLLVHHTWAAEPLS